MAKRFIDTKIWDKSWYRKLDPKDKLIWIYILTKCDHAGIFDADWEAMAFFIKGIGSRNGFQDLPETIKEKMTLVKDDQYFIPSFIEYQYGTLRENSKPHLSVLKRLRDKGLLEGLPKGLVALKDKDKDKVQVKDIDKRKEGFEKEVIEIAKTKKYDIKEVEKFVSYWTEPNRSGKKMLFEMRQVFHIPRRLATWFKNSFNNKKGVNNERKQMHFTGS